MRWVGWIVLALVVPGCGGDECLDDLETNCEAAYEPTFQNVFDNSLKGTCDQAGCHITEAAQAGLNLGPDADTAYLHLTGQIDGVSRVLEGRPACSLMVQRLVSSDPDVRMPPPPNDPLPEDERCAIIQWIDRGARR